MLERVPDRPVLILDVMDTLVFDPAYTEVLRFFRTDRTTFFAQKSKDAYLRFERGELDEVGFRRSYFLDGRDFDLEGLKAALYAGYRWIEGIPDLLGDLAAAGVEMHSMSNYSEWSSMIDDKLGLGDLVPWTFVSWRTGVRKPDAEAYLGAARALERAPAHCLFVDDRAKNVAGAEAVGMPAIQFENADQLRAQLVRYGVL